MTRVATNETVELISSDKVEGTSVYSPAGDKLGSIYNFMVNKRTGQVEYAVLQFGGLLGIGSDFYPLPWGALDYNEQQGGYVVDIDKDDLESAPHYARDATPAFDPAYGAKVYGAYGVPFPAGIG